MTPIVLSIDQVAEVLGCSRSFVYTLLRSGLLPTVQLGDRRKIPYYAVEAFIRQQLPAA